MSLDQGTVLEIGDLSDSDIAAVLERADRIERGIPRPPEQSFVVGSMFLTSSLRTRVGFETAVARLGGTTVGMTALRWDAQMTSEEDPADALRTLSGMVDILVTRTASAWNRAVLAANARCPVINGGDDRDHPTQALIDLYAIRRLLGPVGNLHVGICGDLGMRSVTSLLDVLARDPPRRITLVGPADRSPRRLDPALTVDPRRELDPDVLRSLDVLYMGGLPHGRADSLANDLWTSFRLGSRELELLSPSAVVLSPLPLIDEVAGEARSDPRFRAFDQSDWGVSVRAGLLEEVLVRCI